MTDKDQELEELINEPDASIEATAEVMNIEIEDSSTDVGVQIMSETVSVEDTEVVVVESQNAFAPLGEPNELLKHSLMTGRDLHDQHPITAITGLRDELDCIEALGIVYSDKRYQADYYLWEDNNPQQEIRDGLFVSICEDTNKIKICSNEDEIYGVVVRDAAFVGAQANLQRDYQYGLVVYTGIVAVRCELNVEKGDFVISNKYGVAKKSDSGYGAKVVAKVNIDGVMYALVTLGLLTTQVEAIATSVKQLDARMNTAEANIISVTNTANATAKLAHTLSLNFDDITILVANTKQKAEEALDLAGVAISNTERLETDVASAIQIASQARAIAESAMSSAGTIRDDISGDNDVIQGYIDDLQADVAQAQADVEAAKERIAQNLADIEAMQEDITPLATWTDGDSSGIAGFVARADSDSAQIGSLVTWQEGTDSAIAGIKQDVSDNYAEILSISSVVTDTSDALTSFQQEVTDTYATIDSLTSFESDMSNAIAGVKQYVSDNYATIQSLTDFKGETNEAITGVKQEASDTYATIESLTAFKNGMNESIAGIKQTANEQGARIDAKVSQTYGDSTSLFGWSLLTSGFEIYSNGGTVFQVTESGACINGEVIATSGIIGGCEIIEDGTIRVPAAYIDGKLTASQIETDSLTVDIANVTGELNISGATYSIPSLCTAFNEHIGTMSEWKANTTNDISNLESVVGVVGGLGPEEESHETRIATLEAHLQALQESHSELASLVAQYHKGA